MNTRKLIVKISYGFIAALVVVLVGFLIYQQRQIRQMSQNEGQAPGSKQAPLAAVTRAPVNTQIAPAVDGGVEQLAAEVDSLRYQLEATEEELDMTREDLADEEGGRLGDISNLIAMEKKMRENPTLMNMRRREQENMLSQTHGVLFERLGLPDEELQALKTLMVGFSMEAGDMSLGLIDQSLSEEEIEENLQLYKDQQAEFEKQAKDLLGTENFEALDTYTRSLSERLFVHGLINPLSEDLGLSEEKEQALIDAMYAARQEVEAEHGYDSWDIAQTTYDMSQNPEEGINRQLEILDRYSESARGLLTESQTEQFETRVNERKEMMKMNRSLMAGGDDES